MTAVGGTRSLILTFVRHYYDRQGVSPTITEIAAAAGCSRSSAHSHLQALVAAGQLRSLGRRGYVPTREAA